MPDAPARPRQTTWSGWVILIGSLFVLASVFEVVAGINSLDTRKSAAEFVSTAPGSGLGLDVDQALEILRITAMVAGACAAASAILGWHALRRSRSARVALSVLALPLLLAGTATGGIVSAAVAASVVTLWLPPSADWFAGRTPAPDPRARGAQRAMAGQAAPGASATPGARPGPEPSAPTGSSAPGMPPTSGAPGAAPRPAGEATMRPAGRRPTALVSACVLTWVGSGVVVLFSLITVLFFWSSPELVMEAVQDQDPSLTEQRLAEQGLSVRAIQAAATVLMGVPLVWSVVASVLAGLALAGRPWARVALLASAVVAATACLLVSLVAIVMIVPMAGCLAAAALLMRPEVRSWR